MLKSQEVTKTIRMGYRVYRVPGILSFRQELGPPTLQKCVAPPLGPRGRHTRSRGRGGGPNSDGGKTFWHSRYTLVPLRTGALSFQLTDAALGGGGGFVK
jgi:hypothetical protein